MSTWTQPTACYDSAQCWACQQGALGTPSEWRVHSLRQRSALRLKSLDRQLETCLCIQQPSREEIKSCTEERHSSAVRAHCIPAVSQILQAGLTVS